MAKRMNWNRVRTEANVQRYGTARIDGAEQASVRLAKPKFRVVTTIPKQPPAADDEQLKVQKFVSHTAQAILCRLAADFEVWVPKSQVKGVDKDEWEALIGKRGVLVVSGWLRSKLVREWKAQPGKHHALKG